MTPEIAEVNNGAPVITSAATVLLMQHMLKSTAVYQAVIKAFPGTDKWAHWGIAVAFSGVAALGIHITSTWTPGSGGLIQFAVPNLMQLWDGATHWYQVFIVQQAGYHIAQGVRFENFLTTPVPPKEGGA